MLGLPDAITACLFDLDGVLTQTATVRRAVVSSSANGRNGGSRYVVGDLAERLEAAR